MNHKIVLTVLEARKSTIKAPENPLFGESMLPSSQMAIFSLSSHWGRESSQGLFYKGTNLFMRYLLSPPPIHTIHWGFIFQHMYFGGT